MDIERQKLFEEMTKAYHGVTEYPFNGVTTLKWQDDCIVWEEHEYLTREEVDGVIVYTKVVKSKEIRKQIERRKYNGKV